MQKSELFNPFLVNGYSPSNFCDREEETRRIIDAMKNQRNLVLMSIRRMGKSGLIQHVLQQKEVKQYAECFS